LHFLDRERFDLLVGETWWLRENRWIPHDVAPPNRFVQRGPHGPVRLMRCAGGTSAFYHPRVELFEVLRFQSVDSMRADTPWCQ
jgi:hypothetical protein